QLIHQPNDGRNQFFTAERAPLHIGINSLAQSAKRTGKIRQAGELRFLLHRHPRKMITILLSSAPITAGRLYMAAPITTYPDIAPSRWNGKLSDPVLIRGGNRLFIKTDITKTIPTPQTSNSRRGVVDMKQPMSSIVL